MKTQQIERTVPTNFKELLVLRDVKKLTLKERLKLILGHNLLFEAKIQTQHIVGKTKQQVSVTLTEYEKVPAELSEDLHLRV